MFSSSPTQAEMFFVTEEKNVKRGGCSRSVCSYSVKIYNLGSCWLGFEPRESALCMEKFLVAMKDSRHITPGNPHFLWQPSGGLSWWLFQTSPQVLKACSCSGSQTWTTVGLAADCHTARVSERLYQASDGAAMWGFHPGNLRRNCLWTRFCCKFKDSGPLLNTKLFLRVHLGVRWNL